MRKKKQKVQKCRNEKKSRAKSAKKCRNEKKAEQKVQKSAKISFAYNIIIL